MNRSGPKVTKSPASNPPARPASVPEIANAVSLMRVGDKPAAAVARSLSRTAIIDRPNPLRRMRATATTTTTSATRHTK